MIGNKLYVGNLYCMVKKEQLRQLFGQYGRVRRVDIIPGSGYAYVEMSNTLEAEKAKRALDGMEYLERVLRIKDAFKPVPFTKKDVRNLME
jgi:RNA recognition motif-containing protein